MENTDNTPYTSADIDLLLLKDSILRDIAQSAVANNIYLRKMDAEALEALLYDAVVELDYSRIVEARKVKN